MRPRRLIVGTLGIAALLSGCGERSVRDRDRETGHAHAHDETSGPAAAVFEEDRGLRLANDTAVALGVQVVEVAARTLAPSLEVTAIVFDSGPPAQALALVPAAVAETLEKNPTAEVKVLSVRRAVSPAFGQAEVILALPEWLAVGTTRAIQLREPERTGLAVPPSAILRTAAGSFVYVENDEHFLRTAVKTGATNGAWVEIVDGLAGGERVVSAAVEQLWLTELRLTKGGGHSH